MSGNDIDEVDSLNMITRTQTKQNVEVKTKKENMDEIQSLNS